MDKAEDYRRRRSSQGLKETLKKRTANVRRSQKKKKTKM